MNTSQRLITLKTFSKLKAHLAAGETVFIVTLSPLVAALRYVSFFFCHDKLYAPHHLSRSSLQF